MPSSPCPPVIEYDSSFREQAIEDIRGLPDASAVEAMLADYTVLRDQVRACRGE